MNNVITFVEILIPIGVILIPITLVLWFISTMDFYK